MNLFDSIRRQIVPIHPDGYLFVAIFAVATAVLFFLYAPLGWIGLVLTLWCAYFFRDPPRLTPLDAGLVIAPADGVVAAAGPSIPPPELGLGPDSLPRVSIFMSVFDCHVNRAPVAGRIGKIVYRPGLFLNADLDKASEDNERNCLVIEAINGRVGVVQIAGLIARRILCFATVGQMIEAGDRFGLIRFGSRVDVYLPPSTRLLVATGTRSVGGETIIADFGTLEPPRSFKRS
ncbi:MAG: phosphatidylserine decarboxylase [Methylovirgula sp.]